MGISFIDANSGTECSSFISAHQHHGVHNPERHAVLLSIGCQLALVCSAETPVLALVHPHQELSEHLQGPESLLILPERPVEVLIDRQGQRWCRFIAAAGQSSFRYRATIERPEATDPVQPSARQCPVASLPIDAYPFLNASRYCDTAALMDFAWRTFADGPLGWSTVQAVCDWVHGHIRFDYSATQPEQTASQTLESRAGVCRDFAHLAVTLCRCLNIPARYCTGYPAGDAPIDYSAWFEVYLADRWFVFDARHNIPRCGRVLIARGRDAADVPFLGRFGEHQLVGVEVITDAISLSALQQ